MGLNVFRNWRHGSPQPTPVPISAVEGDSTVPLADAAELLAVHQPRLTALRLESGYNENQFQAYICQPLLQCARYVHRLPASRAENHREIGGLFRFAFETACLAFRRADGRLFGGPQCASESSLGSDATWRYSAFLAGLCSPLGRAPSVATVRSPDGAHIWCPYATSLCRWAEERNLESYKIEWRSHQDARPIHMDSLWIAARLLRSDIVERLRADNHTVVQAIIDVLTERSKNALTGLIAESMQSVIDQDLAVARQSNNLPTSGIRVEHRLLDAMRGLVRDKWTVNTAGSRLWITQQGVFLNWRPAVNDILARLRSDGVSGMPKDADTIAELLIEKAVLTTNPKPASETALAYYFRLVVHAPHVPKHPLDCVQLVSASLLGLQLDTVAPVHAEIAGWSHDGNAEERHGQVELDLDQTRQDMDVADGEERNVEPQAASGNFNGDDTEAAVALPAEAEQGQAPATLARYGVAGRVLAALSTQSEEVFFSVDDGIAIAFPGAIAGAGERPKEFLASCQAQSLIVPQSGNATRLIRKRRAAESHLPHQYIVLVPRLATSLGLTAIKS